MSNELEELDLLIEYRQRYGEFLAVKAAHQSDPGDAAKAAEWRRVKYEFEAFRTHWRSIRDFLKATNALTAAEGDAVASPSVLEMGLTAQEG